MPHLSEELDRINRREKADTMLEGEQALAFAKAMTLAAGGSVQDGI